MKKVYVIMAILMTVLPFLGGQEKEATKFATYQEMRAHIGRLYQQEKYAEAAEILQKALKQFPDHLHANTYNLALMNVQLKEYKKALEALDYGLEKGIWFGKYDFYAEMWAPLKETEGFESFEQKNEARRQEAQKAVKPKLEVLVPEDYDESKKYPLFLALHGGGENIDVFKPRWTSDLLQTEFIVAFPQSSQLVSMDGYNWTEDVELTKKEIREAYKKIIQNYPVNKSRVIIGGFSSGGVASLEVVLDDIVPVMGFVVLCPAKPEDFTEQKVAEAKKRGIRGTLLTTEMDPRLPDQKEMVEIMKAQNLPLEFIVTPNIGHWYPEDLDKKIDAAISHIMKKE
jgi:predicted esterase